MENSFVIPASADGGSATLILAKNIRPDETLRLSLFVRDSEYGYGHEVPDNEFCAITENCGKSVPDGCFVVNRAFVDSFGIIRGPLIIKAVDYLTGGVFPREMIPFSFEDVIRCDGKLLPVFRLGAGILDGLPNRECADIEQKKGFLKQKGENA